MQTMGTRNRCVAVLSISNVFLYVTEYTLYLKICQVKAGVINELMSWALS
jgi:heme O synthase-like polyprenyltransferase